MDSRESLDILFAGLVAEPVQQRAPFKFLDAYGPADRALFFGRDNEIRDLYARFYQGQVLLVYGESGTGKTSLIECGLRGEIPTEEALFVTVRTAQDPFEAVRRALHRTLGITPELELGALVGQVIEQKSKTLVLVFDQFEEFFLFQPTSVRQAFAQVVRDWLDQNGNLRLVVGLREEYLARATELEPYWPGLFRNRLWIRHLARTDAEAAIVGPCAVCGVALEDGLVPQILADLSGGGSEVELPIFQVVLDSLYRRALAETPKRPRLTFDAYRELGQVQTILGRFLEERVQSYAEAVEAARQILKALITAEGTRQFGVLQDIIVRARQFGPELTDERVVELLRRLIGDRLVREDPDQHWYELRHDALAQQIRQWMSGLEQELVDLRQTLENRLREYQRHGRLLEADLLTTLAPYESRLFLRGQLAELVELSKRWAQQRKRMRFWVGTAIFAIVLAFGIFSFVQWQEAKLQKTQAEANFQRTREAVDSFFTQVSQSTLLNQPGLEPLRRQLLEKALNYYEDLAKQRADDSEMRGELASAAFRTGKIRGLLGDNSSAETAYRHAITLFETLTQEYPEISKYRIDLAWTYDNLGILLNHIGNAEEASATHQKSIALREPLAREHPEIQEYRIDLAASYDNLGIVLSHIGDANGAQTAHRKAIDLEELLAREHPEIQEYQSSLAKGYNNLGLVLRDIGDAEGAQAAHRKAITLLEPLAREHPEIQEYQSSLAKSYNNLGLVLADIKTTEAQATYQKAIVIREQLVRKHPDVPEYRQLLARSQDNFGDLLLRNTSDMMSAREALQKAQYLRERLVQEHPEVPEYRSDLAASYYKFGSLLVDDGDLAGAGAAYQKAIDLQDLLVREHPEVPIYRNHLAWSYNKLGLILNSSGNAEGALAAYRSAFLHFHALPQEHPDIPTYQNDLANNINNIGTLFYGKGDYEKARAAYQNALNLWEQLAQKYPETSEYRKKLAWSYYNLGLTFRNIGNAQRARIAYQKAIDLREALVQERPEILEYQNDLAGNYNNLGLVFSDIGDVAEAQAAYQKAIALWEPLAREHPETLEYRKWLASSHNNLSILFKNTGGMVARAEYQKAIDLREALVQERPEILEYRSDLASSYHNLGIFLANTNDTIGAQVAYQKAIDLREALMRAHPKEPNDRDDLAWSYNNLGLLLGDMPKKKAAYQKAIVLWERLAHEFPNRTDYRANWAVVEENLAWAELFSRHPQEAIAAANRGLGADPNQVAIRTNLAHGYLFDNQYEKALAIYTENKDAKLADGRTFAEAVLADFKEFRTKGISHPDMEKIENLLRNPMEN